MVPADAHRHEVREAVPLLLDEHVVRREALDAVRQAEDAESSHTLGGYPAADSAFA